MGIPRLLNYLCDRYPSLTEITRANKLPQYDNLYIDMNFLVHHLVPNRQYGTDDEDKCVDEADIFDRILTAIETLFRLIRPGKLLFLAIDGVAPRAKWNKQRQRRFCVKAVTFHSFDPNCLSPGTEFMQRLDVNLNEFIAAKIADDKSWQNCRIVLSGSNTAGEGSHKIVEYMRYLKTIHRQHLKHCVFSGDTDFLMLGLASHEIYVTLLQTNNRRRELNSMMLADDTKHEFRVIHIEHLREYIEMEFSTCESLMAFKFDMDNIADDWVLLCFLIGNDFLPNLPNFHITTNILPILYDVYKRSLLKLDGYINESGRLNVRRFNVFLNELKKCDVHIYNNHVKLSRIITDNVGKALEAIDLNSNGNGDNVNEKVAQVNDAISFSHAKSIYYKDKQVHCLERNICSHAEQYVRTIQWMLSYYYTGTLSWDWYYPCNYAPFVSDFPELTETVFDFPHDSPPFPLEHLLAIQPLTSAQLLPQPIQAVMRTELISYFPSDITYDLNGKNCDWEAIPLLPFVDRDVFREIMDTVNDDLNRNDCCKLNARKPMIQYECLDYEDDALVDRIELPIVQFDSNQKTCIPIQRTAKFDDTVVNFSHLKCLPYSTHLEKSVHPNQPDRLFIDWIPFEEETDKFESIVGELINKTVFVGWPRVHQARVVSISSSTQKIIWSEETQTANEIKLQESDDEFKRSVSKIRDRADAQGIQIGPVDFVAHVMPFQFEQFVPDARTTEFVAEKVFDKGILIPIAVQTIVKNSINSDNRSRICARGQIKLGSLVFLRGSRTYHGQRAYILAKSGLDSIGVSTYVHLEEEPDFSDAREIHNAFIENASEKIIYRDAIAAAQSIGANSKILSRLTGNVFVFMKQRSEETQRPPRKLNIGLQLKPRVQANAMNDFVKFDGNGWNYSQAAIDLVNEYLLQFPRLAQTLNSYDIFESDFAAHHPSEAKKYLNDIVHWLSQNPKVISARTQIEGKNLPDAVIEKIISSVDAMQSNTKIIKLEVKWRNLYIPNMNNVFVIPDPTAKYQLFDRIIIVRNGYAVPIGAKGTIISINATTKQRHTDVTENNLHSMDILMDKPYKRPSTSICDFKETRIFHVRTTAPLINISHGKC